MVDRDAGGRYTPDHTDEDVLNAVRAHEPAATSEVAGELGITRQGADRRLRKLRDEGRVNSKKIAASLVWFAPSDAEPAMSSGADRGDSPSGSDLDGERDTPPREASHADLEDALTDVDFPTGQDRDDCVAAVYAARDYLRENGPASMRQIVVNVMPEHSLGYDVPELEPGDRYRGSWWRKIVKPGLDALEDVEHRQNYGDYRHRN